MTSSNFKVNFAEPMVHIYQRKYRRTIYAFVFVYAILGTFQLMWGTLSKAIFETQLSNYALVNLIIKKDSRKLNQWLKLVSLARNIFDFWRKILTFLVEIGFFQTNSPGIRRRDIIQQLGTNLWIALRRKKLSIPNICTFYRWGSKKKHFQKTRAIKRNRQDRLHRNQGMTITSGARVLKMNFRKRKHQGGINPSAEPMDKRNSCTIC